MKKTLGGQRLGSGNKQTVDLHGYERSTHDMGYLWRSTMSAGTLVPFLVEVALPGDTFDINLQCDIKTHPTIGPLFGSYKVQLDIFQAPIRLYNAMLHNNALGVGLDMKQVKLPQINLPAHPFTPVLSNNNVDNAQIHSSCILSYLGIRGVGYTTALSGPNRNFNCIPLLAYWEIYKQYYANKQEEIGAVIHTPLVALVKTINTFTIYTPGNPIGFEIPINTPTTVLLTLGSALSIAFTGTSPIPNQIIINTNEHGERTLQELFRNFFLSGSNMGGQFNYEQWGPTTLLSWRYRDVNDPNNIKPEVTTFPLENIDLMRESILKAGRTPYILDDANPDKYYPYYWLREYNGDGLPNLLNNQEGLGLKTYQSDLFNNWLQTEWIDGPNGINEITAVDVSDGKLYIDTLILQNKVYKMLNRIAVSGGTYDDWLSVTYDHEPYSRCESPIYHGGLIKELVFQEVVSNSQSVDQPLGTLAGRGVMSGKHKGGSVTIKVDEPSYIIGIVSLTPRIDYSQGNKWDVNLQTMDDFHKPGLDEIGFQELITEQMAWWDTHYNELDSTWTQHSAGKQPAWINYMTNVNQVRGNFAVQNNEMFMTLNRRYERDASSRRIKDLTTYIDPSKYNHIFAQTSLDAQNFWTQIAVDMTTRRKMSAKVMPNL